jgi:hypothetical protein
MKLRTRKEKEGCLQIRSAIYPLQGACVIKAGRSTIMIVADLLLFCWAFIII